MIPFSDETPVRHVAWVTMALVALCIVAYFAVQPTRVTVDHIVSPDLQLVNDDDLRFLVDNAAIPCEIVQGRPLTQREYRDTFVRGDRSACGDADGPARSPGKVVYLALLASLFLHGSPAHLFGNLLFLWVFGNDIEHRWGRGRYLLLFLLGGIVASLAHVLTDPGSTVPMIGASGAIAAVMGAYLICYPRTRVKTIIFFGFMMLRKVQALWLLLVWLALQFLLVGADSGIAWAAHVGGFVFGVLVGVAWRRRGRDREPVPSGSPGPPIAPLVTPTA
jgi:membrane associated rhomboid family serine protease